MRRVLLVLSVAALVVTMMVASALPALAQGPPGDTLPPGADEFLQRAGGVVLERAEEPNQAIDFDPNNQCVTLDTPGPEGTGHHSGFPDDSPCQP
jgi:hypothetical protein